MKSLSVIMPVFNEEATLGLVVEEVLKSPLVGELICVDDGSTDRTSKILQELTARHPNIVVVTHSRNTGKGAAVRTGIQKATLPCLIIQDADLEYDPAEYPKILAPIMQDRADVVYGSRFIGSEAHRVLYFWHSMGNKFLTLLSNAMTNLNLTDMETCFKAFRSDLIQKIPIEENRFGWEPEITAKIARVRARIYEVAVSYHGRTYAEGKKVGWKDGCRAIFCILKYNLRR